MTEALVAQIASNAQSRELAARAAEERASTRAKMADSISPATKKAYDHAWRTFSGWCADRVTLTGDRIDPAAASPDAIADFCSWAADAGKSLSTVRLWRCAITKAYTVRDIPSPTHTHAVKMTMTGIARQIGSAQVGMDALTPAQIARVIRTIDRGENPNRGDDIRAIRDRALLLLGFATGQRISNLAALKVSDVTIVAEGLQITERRSKTDQEGRGREIPVPTQSNTVFCAAQALAFWRELELPRSQFRVSKTDGLDENGEFNGIWEPWPDAAVTDQWPLFCATNAHDVVLLYKPLHVDRIRQILNERIAAAGIEGHFSGHTMRVSMITNAAKAGKSMHKIMAQSGHKSPAMVLRYIREADAFRDNAVAGVFDGVDADG